MLIKILKKPEIVFIFLIITAAILFGFWDLSQRTVFDWDQARDAQTELEIIKEHKWTLIGPQQAVGHFFLGPLWVYLLLPFYFLSNLNPIGSAVFGVIIQVATTLAFYMVGKKMFGTSLGLLAAFLWLPAGAILVWNTSLIPLVTIIFIFLLSKITQSRKGYIPLAFLWLGICLQIHFQAILFILPLLFSLGVYAWGKVKVPFREITIGVVLLFITFIPLIIFDLRHNFLELHSFSNFFFNLQNQNRQPWSEKLLVSIYKCLGVINLQDKFLQPPKLLSEVIVLLTSFLGLLFSKLKKLFKIILIYFLLAPPILFSAYSGILSEYYFGAILAPLIFGLAFAFKMIFLSRGFWGKLALLVVLIYVLINKFFVFKTSYSGTSLYYQQQAVSYISTQRIDKRYNVSYSTPFSGDAGFNYLFNLRDNKPDSSSFGHLWTIVIPPDRENVPPLVIFGNIGVIRR